MSPVALALVLVGVVLAGELQVAGRTRAGARSGDRGSFVFVMAVFSLGYWAAFRLAGAAAKDPAFLAGRRMGAWSAYAGSALAVGGTLFRAWAVRTLGRWFTPRVLVSADQPVVDRGPYRWVRHPSYSGGIAAALGVGLALANWASFACLAAAAALGFGYRIHVEEAALVEALGEPYRAYRRRTKRLVPFVW